MPCIGLFSRIKVVHKARWIDGQIYIPEMNWILMILSITVMVGLQKTTLIGNAYGPSLGIVRVPGIGLIYTELVTGIPAMFSSFLANLPATHQNDTLLVELAPNLYSVALSDMGYQDVHKDDEDFEYHLVTCIAEFIKLEAEGSATMDGSMDCRMAVVRTSEKFGTRLVMSESAATEESSCLSTSTAAPNSKSSTQKNLQSMYEQELPSLIQRRRMRFKLPDTDHMQLHAQEELYERLEAKRAGVAYIIGHSHIKARRNSSFLKKFVINMGYSFLRKNCRSPAVTLTMPRINLIGVACLASRDGLRFGYLPDFFSLFSPSPKFGDHFSLLDFFSHWPPNPATARYGTDKVSAVDVVDADDVDFLGGFGLMAEGRRLADLSC
ncbi:potassium transporter family protein [Actinidia rufa]|uniref:Potassium transporter family protein n=1 Tax=Actinidia rufa TaxID=165716 RepID=A0A7J0G796_9ERIC|nr:potassium transporter family protein [Actinidia rufa]